MKTKLNLLVVTLGLAALSAAAQVPGIISHQGKVTVNGTNWTGSGAFKFALVNAAGSTTYWSNDGSSSGGAEPTSAVTLATARGVFSVNLGDTIVANMTQSIPASVFTNNGVYLRVWFNDGTDGSQLLAPDRQIVSVGYAMNAGHYAETDPLFAASAAYGIQSGDITSWNAKVGGVTASSPLASSGGGTPNLTIQTASGSQAGALASTDWTTFNSKTPTNRTVSTAAPLTGGGTLAGDLTLSLPAATGSANGYLASADWNTFNNKVGGSGTATYLPVFTGGNTVANSPIVTGTNNNVGIGTTTPVPSAALEIKSTTQGLLLPRLTKAQQNAITNAAPGLLLWCTDAGVQGEMHIYTQAGIWYNIGPIPPLLHIGDAYQGGRVAYLLTSGDPGFDANTQHGLISCTNWFGSVTWVPGVTTPFTGATNTGLGYGMTNTTLIISAMGAGTGYAAGVARAYTGGGYTDWYLPSLGELNLIYANRAGIGGFQPVAYWSSTENAYNSNWATSLDFSTGSQNPNLGKGFYCAVVAIRSF
jgi:hypothetical protein